MKYNYSTQKKELLSYIKKGKFLILLLVFTSLQIVKAQDITYTPNPVVFGNVAVDSGQSIFVQTEATDGTSTYAITSISFSGANASEFSESNNFPPFDQGIPTGEPLQFQFTPTSAGIKTATATIVSDAPDSPHTINLTGSSDVALVPEISFNNINFGTNDIFVNLTEDLIIQNIGNTPLTINNIEMSTINDGSQFSVPSLTFPIIIPAFGTADPIPVTFSPTALSDLGTPSNTRLANIEITSDDPNSPDFVNLNSSILLPTLEIPLLPAPLDFGNIFIGNPSTQNITINNNGNGTLVLSDLSIIAGVTNSHPEDYTIIYPTSFPFNVAPNSSIEVEIEFSPGENGLRYSRLNVETLNATNEIINISGQGNSPIFSAATTQTFTNTRVGETSFVHFDITNNGNADLNISSGTITGSDAVLFEVASVNTSRTITPGNPLTISVSYNPLNINAHSANLTYTSNDINSPHTISLSGSSVDSDLQLSATNLDFENIIIGNTSITQTVTLSNTTGTDAVTISDVNISGPDNAAFNLIGVTIPMNINAGSEFTFDVSFSPISGGNKTAQINIISNDSNSPQTISLTGNSLAPSLNLSTNLLEFLDTEAGVQTRTKPFNIVNIGTLDLTITNITIAGTNASEFTLHGVSLPITVTPLSSETVEVVFSPQSAGMKGAMLTVESNLVGSIELPLLGTGNAPILNASNLNFGDVISNRSKTQTVTINNDGSSNLIISSITIDGTDASLFNLQAVSLPLTIESGTSTAIEIVFDPTTATAGNKTANLNIISNDLNNPSSFPLTSNVVNLPEFSVTSNHLELPDTPVNDSVDVDLNISNTGTSDLIIEGAFFAIGGSSSIYSTPGNNTYPITIPPGSQHNLIITYLPVNTDLQSARIFIHSNDINLPFVSGPFGGYRSEVLITGGTISPGFLVTNEDQNPIVFPDTSIGRTSTTTINVMNTGNEPLEFINVFDANTGMFQIVDNDAALARVVPPGESVEFTLKFIPTGNSEQKNGNISITANVPHDFFSTTEFLIPVTGLAGEPVDVDVDGMIFQADSKIVTGDIISLSGNVHVGNLEFSNDVIVNLLTNEVTCDDCEMFATNIPQIGDFGGERVLLQSGNISTFVITSAGFPELDFTSFGTVTNGLFKMVGIPLEITKIKILADSEDDEDLESDGIEIGGKIGLPAEIFGEDSEIELETIRISTITGVDVVGSIEINPELNVLGIFELNSASANFDTIENSFGGAAEIGFDLMGKGITVAAGFQIIRGSLDSVELEIEVDPGIPIANTGFVLAGGNGFINGLVEPPISIGLGVDIAPAAPLDNVLYFDNMQLSYTFGTSFNAEGTIQLFREDVGGGGVSVFANPNQQGVSLNVWANVFEIFEGEVDLLAENRIVGGENSFNVEMAAKLTVNIPEIPSEACLIGCEIVNGFLPIAIAEVDVSMDNTSMKADVTIAEIATINVEVKTNAAGTGSKFTMGGNIGPLPFSFRNAAQQRGITNLVFENNPIEMALDLIEGRSLLIDANNPYRNSSAFVDVPFILSQSYQNIIVRAKGTNGTPNYTLVLPDGTELTSENAGDFNALHSTYDIHNSALFTMKDTQIGEYIIRLDDSDTYELDVAGAEFAPLLSNVSISQNTSNDDITINWNDQDIDSDATVSFYYDTDNNGGNGLLIEDEIPEDDTTDQITWNANYLKNGTYYVYGKIDDGTNTPKILYANETFTIDNESVVPSTTLVADTFIDTIVLSWSEIIGAAHYLVYIDENPITFMSPSQNVGQNTSFDFTEILPGRTYNFAVKVIFDDGTDLTESNFSNIETISFISTTSNNIPKIETEELPVKNTPCDEYITTIVVSDPDTSDVLTLNLLKFPEGMLLNGTTLEWLPNKDQIGKHEVIAEVNDGNGGIDTKSFTITVFEVDDTAPELTCLENFSVDGDDNDEFEVLDYLSSIIKTDNCSEEDNIILTQDITAGTIIGIGETLITITATDEYDNITTCSFILTVNSTLGINDANLEDSIVLYPNPAMNLITIQSDNIIINKIIIYDLLGKIVLISDKTEIDISTLTMGSYFTRIIDKNGNNVVKKFIKK